MCSSDLSLKRSTLSSIAILIGAYSLRPSPTSIISKWAVGTEISMVNRLADENPDKTIFCLDSVVCPCSTMYRIHPAYLSWVLDGLLEGVVVNQIKVDQKTREFSKIALERMLSVV